MNTAVKTARSIAAGTMAITSMLGLAVPAGADDGDVQPVELSGSAEIASALAEPSTAYLAIDVAGYVETDLGWVEAHVSAGCTGFVVDADGYLATAGHCADPGPESMFAQLLQESAAATLFEDGVTCDGVPCTIDELVEFSRAWKVEGLEPGSAPEVEFHVFLGDRIEGEAARLVDVNAFEDGDVALVKVEATDLPVLPVSADVPAIGSEVVSVGFPGVLADAVSAPTVEFNDGKVTSKATMADGAAPTIGLSARIDHGMSGGPTVGYDGTVIGVNSWGVGDSSSHDFVAPSSLLLEMMASHGVDNTLRPEDVLYREAFAAYEADDLATAHSLFAEVATKDAGHIQAMAWQERTEDGADAATEGSSGSEPDSDLGSEGGADAAGQGSPGWEPDSDLGSEGGADHALDGNGYAAASRPVSDSSDTPIVKWVLGALLIPALALLGGLTMALRRRTPGPAVFTGAAGMPYPGTPMYPMSGSPTPSAHGAMGNRVGGATY